MPVTYTCLNDCDTCPGGISCDPLIHVFVCSGVKTCSEAAGQLSGLEDVLQAEVILLHLIFSMA
jgi:hypothetical protein